MSTRLIENPPLIIVERRFYTESIRLTVDRSRCIFCDVCMKVCPKNAIGLIRREDGTLALSVNEDCSLCGACEPFCPSGAIVMTINDRRVNPIVSSGGLPLPLRKVRVDSSRCKKDCFECLKACPLGAITIDDNHNVKVDEDKCLRCPKCEDACPEKAIKVNPLFGGSIFIDESKCEERCDACVKICPTQAISKDHGEIKVNQRYCILCNACAHLDVCRNGAITLTRHRVFYDGEGFSTVWTKALEKLLNRRLLANELGSRGYSRLRRRVEEAKL